MGDMAGCDAVGGVGDEVSIALHGDGRARAGVGLVGREDPAGPHENAGAFALANLALPPAVPFPVPAAVAVAGTATAHASSPAAAPR